MVGSCQQPLVLFVVTLEDSVLSVRSCGCDFLSATSEQPIFGFGVHGLLTSAGDLAPGALPHSQRYCTDIVPETPDVAEEEATEDAACGPGWLMKCCTSA